MKKLFFLSIMAMMALSINAQETTSCKKKDCKEYMEVKAAKWAERFAMGDAKKAEFTKLYVEYLTALKEAAPQCKHEGKCDKGNKECKHEGKCGKGCEQKTLTDAQANEMLQARLECAAKRIEAGQKRLDVNKRFAPKFKKILTPQQTLKVMRIGHKQGKCKQGNKQGRKHQRMQRCDKRMQPQAHMLRRMQHGRQMHKARRITVTACDSLATCPTGHNHGRHAQ